MYNKQLEAFIQAADFGSFSKAAEIMFISPTAVMQQVNQLENHLDLQLFVRSNRGLELSEAGKSVYADAKYIIQYSKESLSRARHTANKDEYLIRIGVSLMNAAHHIHCLLDQITAADSRFQFHIVSFDDYRESYQEALSGLGKKFDIIAGIYGFSSWTEGLCSALELTCAPIVCAVSRKHRLAAKIQLQIEDLYGESLFITEQGDSVYLDAMRSDIAFHHPKIKLINMKYYDLSIYNQCETTNHIILTTYPWAHVHPMLKILPVNWNYCVPFGLLYAKKPSESVEKLIDRTKKIIRQRPFSLDD